MPMILTMSPFVPVSRLSPSLSLTEFRPLV